MALNKFYIKKWYKMLTGKIILHVEQKCGKNYSKKAIKGYYNDFTNKILKGGLADDELPKTEMPNGETIDFSIAIFQYGLGAYDLYLENNDEKYYNIFLNAVNWATKNQKNNGGWVTFKENENPYSAMAQGEGVSLLLRAYKKTNNKKYFDLAKNAIDFMLVDINNNGCTLYDNDDIFLKEYPNKPVVLNGWIFSLFGLYDYCLVSKDKKTKDFLNKTINTLKKYMDKYDNGYWSMYDLGNKIASPFYHSLHIELLNALADLTDMEIFFNIFSKIC